MNKLIPHILRQNIKNYASISNIGINLDQSKTVYYNLSHQDLLRHEVINNEGSIMNTEYGDVFSVDTGKFTGRSPNDKWIVKNKGSESESNIWWGNINQQTTPEVFDDLLETAVDHFNSLDEFYVYDGYCGTNKTSQKKVRFVHELAWQQHFVKNMFIDKTDREDFEPDFTIINACSKTNKKWREHALNSEVGIVFNIEKKIAVILGTWYGGENKKGIFSLMNYWLPMNDIMTMHCSANIGEKKDTALFFGLSGTGKTTLSADPKRQLIGDDEHGWDDDGIFNLEGGCYAKTINLTEEKEPEIYKAIKTNALLENVFQKDDKTPDYFNVSKTENGRVSYPLEHIDNYYQKDIASHPSNIIFLTCDAFGVLPPVSILSPEQAMYHFLSGYTAKIAGTERGITEPQATFSACFGAAFLTLHPTRYAELLQKKLETHNSNAFLVNTGWTGGSYGVGERMSIDQTRSCIDSILDGTIHDEETRIDPIFGFEVPKILDNVPANVCNPRESWESQREYDTQAIKLARMFQNNYKQYIQEGVPDYSKWGPIIRSKI